MRVEDLMTKSVATIPENASALAAWERMKSKKIHHLVVVNRNKNVIGLVSERDLGSSRGWRMREGRTVGEMMTRQVLTIDRYATVRQAANKMRGRGIGCLPVYDNNKLVGILTVTDLLDMIGRGMVHDAPASRRGKGAGGRKNNPKPRRRG